METKKPWNELTKEEKSARIREGQLRAKAVTQQEGDPLKDAEDTRAQRAALLEKLAALPDEPTPAGAVPGSIIKDGLGPDKVPWNIATLRDYCNRGVEMFGTKFGWSTIIGVPEYSTVSWNGIVYKLFTGIENKIPNVHYWVYMQMLEDVRRERARWDPPINPQMRDGYQAPVHLMGVGPLEPRDV